MTVTAAAGHAGGFALEIGTSMPDSLAAGKHFMYPQIKMQVKYIFKENLRWWADDGKNED
jgi:hypothetical protein